MNSQKTEALIKNIVVGSIIVGVLIAAYFLFVKDTPVDTLSGEAVAVDSVSTADVVQAKVTRTVSELKDLKSALASAIAIFTTPVFGSLENFSVSVPAEQVGRVNPFVITEWKIKIKALEEQARTR